MAEKSNRRGGNGRRETPRPGPERRRAPRAVVRVPGEVVDGPEALSVASINLSSNGILCETPRPLTPFGRYDIVLEVVDGGGARRIRLEAVVVRVEESDPPGRHLAALYFERISDADRAALERFVLAHLPSPSNYPA